LALLAAAFTSTATTFDFLAVLAGAGLVVTTFALLAGMAIPRVTAQRNR
jgi:hypothetical protein